VRLSTLAPVTIWSEAAVVERLDRLATQPQASGVFGFAGHRFGRFPPLSRAQVRAVEVTHRFDLPEDYRTFVTEIENGGAGPGYGIFPLGRWGDSAGDTKPWLNNWGDPSQPFPHEDRWNLEPGDLVPPDTLTQEDADAWFEVKDAQYFDVALVNGTIPIAHLGCAMWVRLVVSGPRRGEVWLDDRASDQGIFPLTPATFDAWYLAWLSDAEGCVIADHP